MCRVCRSRGETGRTEFLYENSGEPTATLTCHSRVPATIPLFSLSLSPSACVCVRLTQGAAAFRTVSMVSADDTNLIWRPTKPQGLGSKLVRGTFKAESIDLRSLKVSL